MATEAIQGKCDIGMVGLGVMGRNFAFNLADHGFKVAGYNLDPVKKELFEKTKTQAHAIRIADSIQQLCGLLSSPRAVMLLVPAGDPVDDVIRALEPHLDHGDLIIDSGNSHFIDTDRRSKALADQGVLFIGMGMSGGESGARNGPSLMPGGSEQGYERVRPIMEAAAAKVGTSACVAYLGRGSAGHYVKMVHNGIEYGLMQLLSETYDLMSRGLGMQPPDLYTVHHRWNQRALNSYLMEITADIFLQTDKRTGRPLIDLIRDEAKQKGTGEWTVADALRIQVPTLNIDAAVMMRHMSGYGKERRAAAELLQGPSTRFTANLDAFVDQLEEALHAAFIITYAQGMALLARASAQYRYNLNLETVARVWSGGCIIRAALLEQIQSAYHQSPDLANLLMDPNLGKTVQIRQADLRAVVRTGIDLGIPVPGLMSALSYWDAYRSGRLPANLIMAQRDYFGAHRYERTDGEGTFHTEWQS